MKKNLILLVEDNLDHEKLALHVLAQGKIINQTVVVRDGQEALDYLFYEGSFVDRPVGNPQVILLDLKLPKVDGLEVLKKIRSTESTKLIPVVILTSSPSEEDVVASYNKGANNYLMKPINIKKFTDSILCFLVYWVDLNQNLE
jgi:CheY-like chemotaxis protein